MVIVTGAYSSKDANIKQQRVNAIANACVLLMLRGEISVSPLIFGLAIIEKSGKNLPDTYEFWDKFCREYVAVSNKVYVLNMDGWEESNGTKDEIAEAKRLNIPVYLVDYITLEHIKSL